MQKRVMWRIVIASPLCVIGVVLLGLLYPLPAQATNHAIVPTCTNNGDGTSYGCAASSGGAGAFKAIPIGASLVCGDIYYLTDYASYPEYTFSKSGCTSRRYRLPLHGIASPTSLLGAAHTRGISAR